MTPKEYLSQAFLLDQRIQANFDEMSRLRHLAEGITSPQLTHDKVQTSHKNDTVGDIVAKIIAFKDLINAEIDALIDLKRDIREKINTIPNKRLRLILQMRYLNFAKWEEIAESLHVDIRSVYRLREKALKNFEVVSKCH